jgi:phosphoadenosine phosphosulfate reductase
MNTTATLSTELAAKVALLDESLARIASSFSPAAFSTSFGAEDMVLLDRIVNGFHRIAVFTLDTRRLHKETYALMDAVQKRYDFRLLTYTPHEEAVEHFEARHGLFSMYDSVENRQSCCYLRKVEPLSRALVGRKAWVTGLRREQAASRAALSESSWDETHRLTKFNPLLEWTEAEVWAYLREHNVPTNALHARGYPSIGCEPCTRATKPGEDARAGRWWWEGQAATQECGLHVAGAGHAAQPNRTRIPIVVRAG